MLVLGPATAGRGAVAVERVNKRSPVAAPAQPAGVVGSGIIEGLLTPLPEYTGQLLGRDADLADKYSPEPGPSDTVDQEVDRAIDHEQKMTD